MGKVVRQKRSAKLARVFHELRDICEQHDRPYYLGRTPISAMHNGNKKVFLRPVFFNDLEEEARLTYEKLAKENNFVAEEFYNKKGDMICLSERQEFIIMSLMEIYNEQCVNVYRADDPDFMRNSITGVLGDVVISPFALACRLFGSSNPGPQWLGIKEELEKLSTSPDTMVLLGYKEKVNIGNEVKLKFRVVYDHLIQIIASADCLDGKQRYAIRLHTGIFFTRLKKNYILLQSGITRKLTMCYNGFPPRHTLNLLEYLLVAGNNKDEKGNRQCQISADLVCFILSRNDAENYRFKRLNDRFHDAVKALTYCGVLDADNELDNINITKGKENKYKMITFKIAKNFFREKELPGSSQEDDNALILTYES